MFKKLFLSVFFCLFSFQVLASETSLRYYVGSTFSLNEINFDNGKSSQNNKAVALNAGVTLNSVFDIELFFQAANQDINYEAYGFDFKANCNVAPERVKLFGSLGLAYYDFDLKSDDAWSAVIYPTVGSLIYSAYRTGVGIELLLNNHWAVNTTARYIYLDTPHYKGFEDMTELSFGIKYTF